MVYFGISGRLGNWLFQYANAMSYGKGVAKGYIIEEWSRSFVERYRELFPHLEVVDNLPEGIKTYQEKRVNYDPLPVDDKQNVILCGYFQSEKYFDNWLCS